jgi:alpha-1,2-mannosyltransferase
VSLFVASLVALFAFTAVAGLTGSLVVAAIAAIGIALVAGLVVWKRFARSIDWAAAPRVFSAASAVAAVVAVVMLARLTVFIVDPSRPSYSVLPGSEWEVRHSCLTAYFVAADIVRRVPNVYSLTIYAAPDDDPSKPRKPRTMGVFRIDQYEYPPPFLLLPRALSLLAPDFLRLRMVWFGLSGLVVLVGLAVVAWHLRGDAATRALLLVPFVLGSIITINTMQKGNVQLAVIAVSMIAMVLVERKHSAAGGALLAFVTMAKLYPGLLVLYLLVRREWRALVWTAAFALLFLVLTLVDVGWQPFVAFRQQFPSLLSGEAFPAFRNPAAVAINQSIPGLVFKLKLFGVAGMGFGAARIVGTLYMLLAVALTVVLARRTLRDGQGPLVWMAILIFATLRSPFLPQSYAPFPAIWLLTLLVATAAPERRSLALFLVGFIVLNIYVPNDSGIDPRLLALVSTISQALTVALAVGVIRRFVMPWNANLFTSPEVFDQHQIATATHQPSE